MRATCSILLALTVLAAHGCVTETTTRNARGIDANEALGVDRRPAPAPRENTEQVTELEPEEVFEPAGYTVSNQVRTALRDVGEIPYDARSLPIVSPDGRLVATQAGPAPSWPTVLARPDASVPALTRIDIFAAERGAADLIASVEETALLGRSYNEHGFLVEAPRNDGSRWIGFADWTSGSVEWLIADDHVNAFATLGPEGQLAWSRRAVNSERFQLAVSPTASVEDMWIIADTNADWLYPTWSRRADGLFALQLEGDRLDLVYGEADTRESFRRSTLNRELVTSASVQHAYYALNGQVHQTDRRPPIDRLLLFHPGRFQQRMAVWQPTTSQGNVLNFFEANSWYAEVDNNGFVLLSGDQGLLRTHISQALRALPLLRGIVVPRPIDDDEWAYMLLFLNPELGTIQLTQLALLPPDVAPEEAAN